MQENNYQGTTNKQLTCRVWAEAVRNLIFIMLVFFVTLPLVFVLLSFVFGDKLFYYIPTSVMIVYLFKYTFFIYPIIRALGIIAFILVSIYLVLSKYSRNGYIFNKIEARNIKSKLVVYLKQYPELYLFGLVFLWITIAFLCSGDLLTQSGFGIDKSQGYIYYLCFALIFVCFFVTTQKQKNVLIELYIATATIIAFISVLIDGFGLPRIYSYSFEETGIFSNRNYYGYYLAITTVLPVARMYKTKNKYLQCYYAICTIINEFALLITLTRGAFVGALIGIVFVLVFSPIQEKKLNIKLVIIPVIFIATFVILETTGLTSFLGRVGEYDAQEGADAISSGRIEIWKGIIAQIGSSPIIGVGFGNTPNPHNEFLQTAAWHGIPALVFYLAALIAMCVKTIKYRSKLTDTQMVALAGSLGYIVSSFFGNGLLQTIPSYIIILALCFNINIPIKNDNETIQKETPNQEETVAPILPI